MLLGERMEYFVSEKNSNTSRYKCFRTTQKDYADCTPTVNTTTLTVCASVDDICPNSENNVKTGGSWLHDCADDVVSENKQHTEVVTATDVPIVLNVPPQELLQLSGYWL